MTVLVKEALLKGATSVVNFDNVSIRSKLSGASQFDVLFTVVLRESPLQTLQDLLASGELELSTTNSLDNVWFMNVLGSHRNQDLSNSDAGGDTDWLSVRMTHTGGETIGSGARKHFIGSQHMEWVGLDANVIVILSDVLDKMLIDCNAASFKRLGRNLLLLITNQVRNEREEINSSLLGTYVKDPNLRFWDTAAVARLDVRFVLLVTVTTGWTATHDTVCRGESENTENIE